MLKRTLHLCVLVMMAGCASLNTIPATSKKEAATPASYTYADSALGDLLIAEVSLQRDLFPLALDYYQRHAQHSQSPAISEQSTLLALHLGKADMALNEAHHWLKQTPNNATAHEAAALAHIMLEQVEQATEQIDLLLQLEPEHGLTSLLTHSQGIGEQHTALLVAALASLADKHPQQGTLWYAKALKQQDDQQPKSALKSLNKALRITPEHVEAQLLKARLLFDTHRRRAALRYSNKQSQLHPSELRLQAQHIRLLIEAGKEKNAQRALTTLATHHPNEQELRLALAIFAMEQGLSQTARQALEQLLTEGYRQDDIRLYLGHNAEQAQDYETALFYYQKTQSREANLKAGFQAARLYHLQKNYEASETTFHELRQKYPEHALDLYLAEADLWRPDSPKAALAILHSALQHYPDNSDLLYFHALMAEQNDDIPQAERDLRLILQHDPLNAAALNALGYILTDRTDRHEEAYIYIKDALQLEPDNPAILDSKGWVLFHLGRNEEALHYLQRSYEAMKDDEVAAHLIKVLQALGLEAEAESIQQHHPSLNEQ